MGLLNFISKRKAARTLENEYCCLIYTWTNVENLYKKCLISNEDAQGVIYIACEDARKILEEVKQTNIEIYNKYSEQFERCFAQMTAYAKSVSTDLSV